MFRQCCLFSLSLVCLLFSLSCASEGAMDREDLVLVEPITRPPRPVSLQKTLQKARNLQREKKVALAAKEAWRVFFYARKDSIKKQARQLLEELVPPSSLAENLKEARKLLGQKKYLQSAKKARRVFLFAGGAQQNGEALFLLGEAHYRAGNYQEAYRYFKQIESKYSSFSQMAKVLGRMYEIGAAWVHGRRHSSWYFFTTEDLDMGFQILNHLVESYPYLRSPQGSLLADDVLLAMAEGKFNQANYKESRNYYRKILRQYSESEWRDLAAFKIGLSYFRESEGVEYDQTPLDRAKKNFLGYLQKFPQGNQVKKVQKLLVQIRESQAGQMFQTALFYRSKSGPLSAVIYHLAIARQYPETSWGKKSKKIMEQPWAQKARGQWKKKK